LINLYENDFVQLNCFTKFTGNPGITYKWFKNDIEVENELLAPLSAVNNVLYIRDIDNTNHLDRYTCGIINEALDEALKANVILNVHCK
jgi:hypothetical protein